MGRRSAVMAAHIKYVLKTGDRFGNWTVLEHNVPRPETKDRSIYSSCLCELCGDEHIIANSRLVNGRAKTCNSCNIKTATEAANAERKLITLENHKAEVGREYGLWTVIGIPFKRKNKFIAKEYYVAPCRCVCGAKIDVKLANLRASLSSSCKLCAARYTVRRKKK